MASKVFGVMTLYLLMVQSAAAQPDVTVQLPTFRTFYTTGSVLVPDRGSSVIGGSRAVSSGYTAFGPGWLAPHRGVGHGVLAGQASVQATIHDFDAMDDWLLRTAGENRDAETGTREPQEASTATAAPLGSVRAARAARGAELALMNVEANEHVLSAERASAAGKPGQARIYYQMAMKRASGALRDEIAERLAALPSTGQRTTKKLKGASPQ